jgi:hypothetical protein
MELGELFRLPEQSMIASFAEAQVHLYRHNGSLHDYFMPLQFHFGKPPGAEVPRRALPGRAFNLAASRAYRVARAIAPRRYSVDVLYCPTPYFSRRTENNLLVRTLMGLARTNATILCLLCGDAQCRAEIESKLEAEGRSGQVTLLDPTAAFHFMSRWLFDRVVWDRCNSAFAEVREVLQPFGWHPPEEAISGFEQIAKFAEAWRSLEDFIEFNAVVARCHWYGLCSPACRTARQRGKPVITFQQGVIGHTLDVPVSASKYIAFGRSSAGFLARMNRSFFQAVGRAEPAVEFVPGGSLFDTILNLPNQFSKHTVLIIDEPIGQEDFYGIKSQREAIFCLAEKLLRSSTPPQLIIRPHPYWNTLGLDAWKDLVRKYPDFCEISHTAWTLEDDLNRSSVALGISSGALTVAAASGLPAFFMAAESGYATDDLACFRPGQTYLPDEAFREISRVLTDARAFAEARAIALRNAREYYADGTNLELSAAFFERMLDAKPLLHSSCGTTDQ